jgi:hypothetical protein
MKEISSTELRELTIEFFKNEETTKPKEIVKLFSNYINAYCAEMKKNEYDILFNDELYEFVYSIFHTLVYKTKVYGIEKNC